MTKRKFLVIQQYLSKDVLMYYDELFSSIYHDVGGFTNQQSIKVFQQGRRLSLYGVRGVGKSTAMNGILYFGLKNHQLPKPLPITIKVSGASAIENSTELQDKFYRSVLAGIIEARNIKKKVNILAEMAKNYAPWIAHKITEAAGLIFPPIALSSDIAEKGVKWLLKKLNQKEIEYLITSKDVDVQHSTDLLISYILERDVEPIFIIDELDKVRDDSILSDFFDGNQSWFMQKRVILSLSYTFGESIRSAVVSSVRRFSDVEPFQGVLSIEDASKIILSRAFVGLSQLIKDEKKAYVNANKIFPKETIKTLVDVAAPITHLILEKAYKAIENAIFESSDVVEPRHVLLEEEAVEKPTELELSVLNELNKGKLTPIDLAEILSKHKSSISRILSQMMKKNWVTRTGLGKRAYYSITEKGLSARMRGIRNEA